MIKELTPLRFALCMMILFHHVFNYAAGGSAAVSTFFILSGFCLTLGYKEQLLQETFDTMSYYQKRLVKIFPIHWITLCVWLILAFLFRDDFTIHTRSLVTNVFLLQSWIPSPQYYFSYNDISWYLSTALFAYVCFPMLAQQIEQLTRKNRAIALGCMLFAYAVLVYALPDENYHAILYINPCFRLVDFIIGIFTANLYLSNDWNRGKHFNLLVDAGIVLAFVALNAVGIMASEQMRLVAAIYWVPAVMLILLHGISSKRNTYLSRFLSQQLIQKFTQCSFSLMMWSIIYEQYAERLPVSKRGGVILLYLFAQISYYIIEKKLARRISQFCIQTIQTK